MSIMAIALSACGWQGPSAVLDAPGPPPEPPPAGPWGPPESIFERSHRVEVRVELPAEDWERLSLEGMSLRETLFPASGRRQVPPYTRMSAEVSVDGVVYTDVAVRKKGYVGSLSTIRPSLKLDFERNQTSKLIGGMRRMTLNNDLQDASHIKQCLAYDLFAEVGVPTPRCNFAHVVVNGVDLGVYTHVEDVEKPMLARHFADDGGNLYEGTLADFTDEDVQYFEPETNSSTADGSELGAVARALLSDDTELLPALGRLVDLDNFFSFWAAETFIGHWDGYASNANNFYVYADPESSRLHFIPWGTDQAFVGDNPLDSLAHEPAVYATGALSRRLYENPEGRARYRGILRQLAEQWSGERLTARAGALAELVPEASAQEITRLGSYLRNHAEVLSMALAAPAPEFEQSSAEPPEASSACLGDGGAVVARFAAPWSGLFTSASDDAEALWTVLQEGGFPESIPELPALGELSVEIDGERVSGSAWALAGETSGPIVGRGDAYLSSLGQVSLAVPHGAGGWFLLARVVAPLSEFKPGRHPLHSFESLGDVRLFHPATGTLTGGFGVAGDGWLVLDKVSLQPGGVIEGHFEAVANYFACASEIRAGVDAYLAGLQASGQSGGEASPAPPNEAEPAPESANGPEQPLE